jgi:cell division septation protein DedD
MKPNHLFFSMLAALYTGVFLTCTAAFAQSPEEQAKTILQLFEAGQKDSAYQMIEPLKKSARFVPAVIYTRAYLTPDDRALALYKEVIALEPGGTWADQAAYQLVLRYAEKRDSLAAHTWATVLRLNYPRSPMLATADDILAEIQSWRAEFDDLYDVPPTSKGKTTAKETSTSKETTAAKEKSVPVKKVGEKKEGEKKEGEKKETAKKVKDSSAATPTETYSGSGMRGYALQVGLFPTKQKADTRAGELKKKNIRAIPLPKMVKGKKQYALVIGPYSTADDATKKKATVAGACDCQPFMVMVK